MGYQRVVKPKFFVDQMSYLHATGHGEYFTRHEDDHGTDTEQKIYFGDTTDLIYCNTSSLLKFNLIGGNQTMWSFRDHVTYKYFPVLPINFAMVLNHNLEGTDFKFHFKDGNTHQIKTEDFQDTIINWGTAGSTSTPEHNGFSLRASNTTHFTTSVNKILAWFSDQPTSNVGQRYVGSTILGHTYSPPHNPNLSMTVSRSFDGIKQTKTQGGHTMNNINYLGNPNWAGHNAWELWNYPADPSATPPNEDPDATQQQMFIEDPKLNLGRLGRRSWKLTFELVSESDIFAALEQSNILPFDVGDTYPEGTETFTQLGIDNPILQEDNFISRVWIPTLGGKIPMLMQVDDTNNNPDQFAIVTIKSNTFSVKPKAPNLYSFSMILEESW